MRLGYWQLNEWSRRWVIRERHCVFFIFMPKSSEIFVGLHFLTKIWKVRIALFNYCHCIKWAIHQVSWGHKVLLFFGCMLMVGSLAQCHVINLVTFGTLDTTCLSPAVFADPVSEQFFVRSWLDLNSSMKMRMNIYVVAVAIPTE